MTLVLEVRFEGVDVPAGFLVRDNAGTTTFVYSEQYLSSPSCPLSMALPLRQEPFGDAVTRAFFLNLLPENDQLYVLLEREGLARDDVTGILFHLGADCPGAISCIPADSAPVKFPGRLGTDYDLLEHKELSEIVRRLADREPLPSALRDPSPIAGVQRKIALAQLPSGQFALPKPALRVPTTHILKVPRRGRGREARLEEKAALLSSAASIPTAIPQAINVGGIDALLIRRFDRAVGSDGTVSRIHQEDFAQALGLPASLKYERNGRPGRRFDASAISRLLDATAEPAVARERFLLATIFNLVIGNTDNHAKNHALLYDQGPVPRLAPLYDLVPIRLDSEVRHDLSFRIGEAEHFEKISFDDLASLLATFGLSRARGRRFITENIKTLLAKIEEGSSDLVKEGLKDFHDLIGSNISDLSKTLNIDVATKPRDHYTHNAGGWGTGS